MAKEKNDHIKLSPKNPTVQLICAVTLFLVAVWAPRSDLVASWDIWLFRLVYDLPRVLYVPFLLVTQMGSVYMLGLLSIIYFARSHYQKLLRILLTGLLAYLLTGFAKDLWGGARPYELFTDVTNLDIVVRGPGFPSGHMALATALALTVGYRLPRRQRWIVPVWIIGVGISRMYLGVHAPIDVVGGFAIGWASYALFRHIRFRDTSPLRKRSRKTSQ